MLFGSYLRKFLLLQGHTDILLYSLLKICIILAFITDLQSTGTLFWVYEIGVLVHFAPYEYM